MVNVQMMRSMFEDVKTFFIFLLLWKTILENDERIRNVFYAIYFYLAYFIVCLYIQKMFFELPFRNEWNTTTFPNCARVVLVGIVDLDVISEYMVVGVIKRM